MYGVRPYKCTYRYLLSMELSENLVLIFHCYFFATVVKSFIHIILLSLASSRYRLALEHFYSLGEKCYNAKQSTNNYHITKLSEDNGYQNLAVYVKIWSG